MSFYVDDRCCLAVNKAQRGYVVATPSDTTFLDELGEDGHRLATLYPIGIAQEVALEFSDTLLPPPDTVVVQWDTQHLPQLIAVSELEITSHTFLVGDLVTQEEDGSQQGLVVRTRMTCSLLGPSAINHKVCGRTLYGHCNLLDECHDHGTELATELQLDQPGICFNDVSSGDITAVAAFRPEDTVLYKGWLGTIDEFREEITVRLFDNSIVTLPTSAHPIGLGACSKYNDFYLGDFVVLQKTDMRLGQWVYGSYDPRIDPIGCIVKIRIVQMRIRWQIHRSYFEAPEQDSAMPAEDLGVDELESSDFFHCDDLDDATVKTGTAESTAIDTQPHTRYIFRAGMSQKYADRQKVDLQPYSRSENLGFDMCTFQLGACRQEVDVLWQDGTVSTQDSRALSIETGLEIYHFPGSIVQSARQPPEKGLRVGVVQSINATENLAKVRWFTEPKRSNGCAALPEESHLTWLPEDSTLSESIELISTYELKTSTLDCMLSCQVYLKSGARPESGLGVSWLGRVVEKHLDGTYTIHCGLMGKPQTIRAHANDILAVPILTPLDVDSMTGDHGKMGNGSSDAMEDVRSDGFDEDLGTIMMGDRKETIEYITEGSGDLMRDARCEDQDEDDWSTDNSMSVYEDAMDLYQSQSKGLPKRTLNGAAAPEFPLALAYVLLECPVPVQHHYMNEAGHLAPSALRKVMKEHTILGKPSAIPSGIFVRSWETNCNLFRAVIIGPCDTPYSCCPFIFDILLPTNYPSVPPKVHFHHLNIGKWDATARVNPNMYETGYVCLSLLNTWQGKAEEGWQPGKSTLLQFLISIQSLILVREPFYNEPGFEERRSANATQAQNVAYNERVLLQSRDFLRQTLIEATVEGPASYLESVTDIIRSIYLDSDGTQLLAKAIGELEDLTDPSQQDTNASATDRDGITRVSKGACVVLRRSLHELKELAERLK